MGHQVFSHIHIYQETGMAVPGILSLGHRHIIHVVAYVLGGRTHNTAVIQLILNIMGHPAHNAAAHKQRCL